MENAPSPSFITAITVLDTLVRAGMRHILISPGSRSAPLAYAAATLADAGVIEAHVRIDERTASFTALGIARATGAPVSIITTSGTAVGQCLPALMEAYHTGAPLALLSADRPARLLGTGANQTTDQAGIFGNHLRAFAQLENYTADPADPQSTALNRALAALTGRSPENWDAPATTPRGPVQLNLGFDTPLTPTEADAVLLTRWANTLRDLPEPQPLPKVSELEAESWLRSDAQPETSYRTVVVAGDGAGDRAARFAQKLGLPLLAEPSSNARYSSVAVPAYRQVLAGQLGEQIERAIVFGHPTLSRPVAGLLANAGVERRLYTVEPAPWHAPDALGYPTLTSLDAAARFAGTGHTNSGRTWLTSWLNAGQAELTASADLRADARALALDAWNRSLDDDAVLVLGSSNLIRDLDLVAPAGPASPLVYANRGLAGIDGTLATAAGISLGLNRPVRVLCGDLTFLHDSGSLNIGPLERRPRVEVLVYDDRGGGIFSTLEHGTLATTEQFGRAVHRFFTTPHTADIPALAVAWGENGYTVRVVTPPTD